jgi:hypothetical protein
MQRIAFHVLAHPKIGLQQVAGRNLESNGLDPEFVRLHMSADNRGQQA